jgi:putative DNA primase/helicase
MTKLYTKQKFDDFENKIDQSDTLETVLASEIEMEAIEWFWQQRIARGALNILVGMPDRCKGQITAFLSARTTNGGSMPCLEGYAPDGNVIILTAEDDLKRTVVPRLNAAGADLKRIKLIKMIRRPDQSKRMFNLVDDLTRLEEEIERMGNVALVIIDPISAYLGVRRVAGGSSTDVRGVLGPVTDLAERTQAAFLAVMHFNKKADVNNAVLRVSDSVAYVAAARTTHFVVRDMEHERSYLFAKAKNNLSMEDTAIRYRVAVKEVGIDKKTGKPIEAPYVVWEDVPVTVDETDVIEAENIGSKAKKSRLEDAVKFLQERLGKGQARKMDDLLEEAKANLISRATLYRAKSELHLFAIKDPNDGEYYWEMPPT